MGPEKYTGDEWFQYRTRWKWQRDRWATKKVYINKPLASSSFLSLFLYHRAVIRELIETEEEFSKDLQNVVERYIKAVDAATAPRTVRDSKDVIFGNFQQIAEFHNM